ncbi:MAG: hypothetical protein QM779_05435 [Propionicimonas sp.]|uniref:hypothetical protein n=1 Tax=Propionicimonas sp. TaxID=1955623 RepID=UPI003D0FB691
MLSYAVIDRDRERLVEDLDIARQIEPTPTFPRKVDRRHWFRRAMTEGETIRTRLASV